jgi:hypothetical protein
MPFRAYRGHRSGLLWTFATRLLLHNPSPPLPSFPLLDIENNNAKSDSILLSYPFHAAFFLG